MFYVELPLSLSFSLSVWKNTAKGNDSTEKIALPTNYGKYLKKTSPAVSREGNLNQLGTARVTSGGTGVEKNINKVTSLRSRVVFVRERRSGRFVSSLPKIPWKRIFPSWCTFRWYIDVFWKRAARPIKEIWKFGVQIFNVRINFQLETIKSLERKRKQFKAFRRVLKP